MPRGRPVPITPSVLDWAISNSGYSRQEVSEKLGVSIAVLKAWLGGTEQPTLTPLRELANVLKRPLATFLLPNPPRSTVGRIEFRHPPGEGRTALNSVEIANLREASRLQEGLAWILSELGDTPVSFPIHSISSDYVRIAQEERERLGVTIQQQLQWTNASQALNAWRRALEEKGVMVLLLSIGSSSSRGFSLWNDYAPIIAANTHWNNQARIFTLFHEYAHLITRTSSSCTGHVAHRIRQGEDPVERWCERFAAAFLAPWEDVQRSLIGVCGWSRGEVIRDLSVLRKLANLFRISLRAMALRLIDHDVAGWDLYSQIPLRADGKPAGGGGGGRNRLQIRLDEYGLKPARIFVRGLHNDVLSRTDVLDYLDIGDSDLDFVESGRTQG